MFKDLGDRVEGAVLEGIGKASSRVQETKPLRADLLESDEAFLAVFDAPGITSDDVEVRFDDNTVRVSLERFRDYHEGFEMRIPGRGLSLHGSVDLPADAAVDAREAEATLTRNGTLQVRIPKAAPETDVAVDDEQVGTEDVERSGSGVGAEADAGSESDRGRGESGDVTTAGSTDDPDGGDLEESDEDEPATGSDAGPAGDVDADEDEGGDENREN